MALLKSALLFFTSTEKPKLYIVYAVSIPKQCAGCYDTKIILIRATVATVGATMDIVAINIAMIFLHNHGKIWKSSKVEHDSDIVQTKSSIKNACFS